MGSRRDETPGEVATHPDDRVCHWCGVTTNRYAVAQLAIQSKVNSNVTLRSHVICEGCHPKVRKGIEDAAKNRAESREIKPTRRIERSSASDYRRWEEKEG